MSLAASILFASMYQLYRGAHPETTLPGVVIAVISLSFMFYLWAAKKRVGKALNSATVLNDAACSLACIKLSGVLLAGSFLFMLAPNLWWVDSVAGPVLAGFVFREGREAVQLARSKEFDGGGCGCS